MLDTVPVLGLHKIYTGDYTPLIALAIKRIFKIWTHPMCEVSVTDVLTTCPTSGQDKD
jgi:hypothetical protein